jgi:peptidylamidoglycolate lyase
LQSTPKAILFYSIVPIEFGRLSKNKEKPTVFLKCLCFHWLFPFRSFNDTDYYQSITDGPIQDNTIVTLDAATGDIIEQRGSGLFYMPHGMTIDRNGNMWLTDVALHQVFKFQPEKDYPSITLGRRFEPGNTRNHLCKPTAVAVASTGEVGRRVFLFVGIFYAYSFCRRFL